MHVRIIISGDLSADSFWITQSPICPQTSITSQIIFLNYIIILLSIIHVSDSSTILILLTKVYVLKEIES